MASPQEDPAEAEVLQTSLFQRGLGYVPGMFAIAMMAALAVWLHETLLASMSVAVPAILFGVGAASLPGTRHLRRGGEQTYGIWLRLGAVLLGAGVDAGAIGAMGWRGLVLVGLKIALAFLGARFVLRRFLPANTARLLGIGNSVCGVSAILVAKDRLGASDAETAAAANAVLAVGTLAVFAAPVVALHVHPAPYIAGAICGLGVDNTAEAIASGGAFGPIGLQMASMFKLTRNALLGFVVALSGKRAGQNALRALIADFPPFIAGYFLLAGLRLMDLLDPQLIRFAAQASQVAFALAFAGVGLALRRELSAGHARNVLLGAVYLFATLAVSAGLVLLIGP
ncbi:MAG: putative sulfate exporter family transporter [Thermaerobacter sp.]|nr:putative sulfate exporter family transporter [Thermaerobacter sp.]